MQSIIIYQIMVTTLVKSAKVVIFVVVKRVGSLKVYPIVKYIIHTVICSWQTEKYPHSNVSSNLHVLIEEIKFWQTLAT